MPGIGKSVGKTAYISLEQELATLRSSLGRGLRIGVVGSRRRDESEDYTKCFDTFNRLYQDGDSIVSGGCQKGADRFAEEIARTQGISITIHYPNKIRDGIPGCFFVRNTLIARDCDILLALVTRDRTGGTEDTVAKALALKKRVIYI